MIYFLFFASLQANSPKLISSLDDLGAFRLMQFGPGNKIYYYIN